MRSKNNSLKLIGVMLISALIFLFVAPEIADARRGGFGGRRGFSRRTPKRSQTRPRANRPKAKPVPKTKQSSFGGNRMTSAKQYTSKYGAPRKTTPYRGKNAAGMPQNYRMHGYGGYGSSLMTGYMMGATSWMWMMPFHPAFYYSRPSYVNNADGTIGVYPPTFSFSRVLFTILIVGGILYIVFRIFKNRKLRNARATSQSSFR